MVEAAPFARSVAHNHAVSISTGHQMEKAIMDATSSSPGAVFTAIKRVRSFEDVVGQIREAIVSGSVVPGARLPNERELAESFGVSRPTLREGLRSLEATGMIEIRPGKTGGIFIAQPDVTQVAAALDTMFRFQGASVYELAEFRTTFEGENAFWAAERADERDLSNLDTLCTEFSRLANIEETPWAKLSELDIDFHEAIAVASKNQVRIAIMLGINRAFYRVSSSLESLASMEVRAEIGSEMRSLERAIAGREADTARSLMLEHVHKFSELEKETDGREL